VWEDRHKKKVISKIIINKKQSRKKTTKKIDFLHNLSSNHFQFGWGGGFFFPN